MRRLLLPALGAAGSLLLDLTALAQLSNTTSTFTGEVAATCEFNLPENISLSYRSDNNTLSYGSDFVLTTNTPVIRMSVSELTVIKEPPPRESAIVPEVRIRYDEENMSVSGRRNVGSTSEPFPVSTSTFNRLVLEATVQTSSQVNSLYQLPPGEYSYRATVTCLQ